MLIAVRARAELAGGWDRLACYGVTRTGVLLAVFLLLVESPVAQALAIWGAPLVVALFVGYGLWDAGRRTSYVPMSLSHPLPRGRMIDPSDAAEQQNGDSRDDR